MKIPNSTEHQLLPIPFTILTLCGFWYPKNWSYKYRSIYKVYTIIIIFLGIVLFCQILTNIILTSKNGEINFENIFAFNVFVIGLYKVGCVLHFHQAIISLIHNRVEYEWYEPKNKVEIQIQEECRNETSRLSSVYAVLIGMAVFLKTITPILESKTLIILPLEGWYPYNVNNTIIFCFTFLHQVVSGTTLTCVHLSSDTMFVGFMLQMSYQLNIFQYRLKTTGSSNQKMQLKEDADDINIKDLMNKYIQEHERIYQFGVELQTIFKPFVAGQMVVLVPNLIINVYFLSVNANNINLKYFMTIFLAVVPMMQIYMFCWYGNEITLGCSDIGDALYECDWTAFSTSTKKILLTVITRSSKSFILSAASVIPLNIDSYIKIMKTSYSAFNLLQQSTNY